MAKKVLLVTASFEGRELLAGSEFDDVLEAQRVAKLTAAGFPLVASSLFTSEFLAVVRRPENRFNAAALLAAQLGSLGGGSVGPLGLRVDALEAADVSYNDITSGAASVLLEKETSTVKKVINVIKGTATGAVLPAISAANNGRVFIVKLEDLAAGATITPTGGDTIDGEANYAVGGPDGSASFAARFSNTRWYAFPQAG